MKHTRFLSALIAFSIVAVGIFFSFKVGASTSGTVITTVKISVCGNGILEGGEQCDGADMSNRNCSSLGYGSGTLGCTASCELDTSLCVSLEKSPFTPAAPSYGGGSFQAYSSKEKFESLPNDESGTVQPPSENDSQYLFYIPKILSEISNSVDLGFSGNGNPVKVQENILESQNKPDSSGSAENIQTTVSNDNISETSQAKNDVQKIKRLQSVLRTILFTLSSILVRFLFIP